MRRVVSSRGGGEAAIARSRKGRGHWALGRFRNVERLLIGGDGCASPPSTQAAPGVELSAMRRRSLKLHHFNLKVVPWRGLEPPRLSPLVPETSASTNSATRAFRSDTWRASLLSIADGFSAVPFLGAKMNGRYRRMSTRTPNSAARQNDAKAKRVRPVQLRP